MTKRERARAARAMATAMRVGGDKEGEGSKAIAMATRIVGKLTATATKRVIVMGMRVAGKQLQWRRRQRGLWQQQQWWRAAKRVMVVVARTMVMATRVAGKQIDVALINYRNFLCHDMFLPT